MTTRTLAPTMILGLLFGCMSPTVEGGPGSSGEKAAGREGCAITLADIELRAWPDDRRQDYLWRVIAKAPTSLLDRSEGYEPWLEWKQQKEGRCLFNCGDGPEYHTGEIEAYEDVGRPENGIQKVAFYLRIGQLSDQDVEVTPVLRAAGKPEKRGPTYRTDLGLERSLVTVAACPGSAVPPEPAGRPEVNSRLGIELSTNPNPPCATWDELAAETQYDSQTRWNGKRNLCIIAASSNADVETPEVVVHYRYGGAGEYKKLFPATLFEQKDNGYQARFALELDKLDPFEDGACEGVPLRVEGGRYYANAEVYVTMGDYAVTRTESDPYRFAFVYEEGERYAIGCDEPTVWEEFQADRLPEIIDATPEAHTREEGLSRLCYSGADSDYVQDAEAVLYVPENYGRPLSVEVTAELRHHWHGDLFIALEHKKLSDTHPFVVQVFGECSLGGSGQLKLPVDVSRIMADEVGGEWTLRVRDYAHDYSGWQDRSDSYREEVTAFSMRLVRDQRL